MSASRTAWLTGEGHEQVLAELNGLLRAHGSAPRRLDDEGVDGLAIQEWRERRIRDLREVLLRGEVGTVPADDGVAEPGMLLTVRFDEDHDLEVFLLAHGAPTTSTEVCSPDSPIGRALAGARPGEVRTCLLPSDVKVRLTLVSAVPWSLDVRGRSVASS